MTCLTLHQNKVNFQTLKITRSQCTDIEIQTLHSGVGTQSIKSGNFKKEHCTKSDQKVTKKLTE